MNTIEKADSWTVKLGLGTGPVSPSIYTDQKRFELERDKIFRRYWLNLGASPIFPKLVITSFTISRFWRQASFSSGVATARSERSTMPAPTAETNCVKSLPTRAHS